jgi:hypothetical protein
MKKRLVGFIAFIVAVVGGIWAWNYQMLQTPMNAVLASDPRSSGIQVQVHFGNYVNPSLIVYNMVGVSGETSDVDVFRTFLQFAEKLKTYNAQDIELQWKGQSRFRIKGDYFKQLGTEYGTQNPVYTTETFAQHVLDANGKPAYSAWEGGFLGVATHELQDFDDFHTKWWKASASKEQ